MTYIRSINPSGRPNTVVLLGDSITSNNYTVTATAYRYDSRGFFTVANALLGWPLTIVNNAGVSGNTTADILARISTDVLAYNPGYCVYQSGRNDLATAVTAAQIITNDTAIFLRLKAYGILTFVLPILPTVDLSGVNGTANVWRDSFGQVNRFRRAYCEANPGFIYVDYGRAIADPSTGLPQANTMNVDNQHPSPLGCMSLGRCLADAMATVIPPMDTSIGSAIDPLNYIMNPFAAGSNSSGTNGFAASAGMSGVGPNGWYARSRNTATSVSSKISRSSPSWALDGMAQVAVSCAADYDAGGYYLGGSDVAGTGRYDVAWAATTAYSYNARVVPTVANGFCYTVFPGGAGTSAGSQPTWPTEDGAQVTDGTVTWMCQKLPTQGDQFYAEVDLQLSSLTGGWAVPVLQLDAIDTSSVTKVTGLCNYFDLAGAFGQGFTYFPTTMRLRTPTVTLPSMTTRYLRAFVLGYGQSGASFNLAVGRAQIKRVN